MSIPGRKVLRGRKFNLLLPWTFIFLEGPFPDSELRFKFGLNLN